ncbi:DUF554 domain-containing protein [Bacillus sp. 1P06AnD]|uniref:DUF554 domain-containing protein n=1 Tax=Bacillus sp. 1P06AnD TaxID=3132208 RepID=UPI00399F0C1B
MIGTLVNCGTILAGSLIGSIFKKGIKESYHEILMQAMGLAAMALGISSIVKYMPASHYPVLFIASLAIGGLAGEKMDFESHFKKVVSIFSKGTAAEGLSTAIILFCVGTLSIVGPIESALKGNHTYLFTNAILDGVTSIVLASSFGLGIAFSAIVLFCWQGFFYVLAGAIEPLLTTELLTEISIIGGVLILSSGISILGIKQIKTMNLLPALLVPPLFMGLKHVCGF